MVKDSPITLTKEKSIKMRENVIMPTEQQFADATSATRSFHICENVLYCPYLQIASMPLFGDEKRDKLFLTILSYYYFEDIC